MNQEDFNPVPLLLMGGAAAFLYASAASMLIGLMEKPIGGSRSTEISAVSSEAVKEIMRELDPAQPLDSN
jgi:hypothetical protein